ncbi:conserved Plasmodium protein, unknown function [Plasmodium ovale]|uniref:PH domain-containing protein n=1 Tax=Plasmodium ovale TaxID=36330 RepID=A0A1C3KT08_PLAOA|nr:conserved Plasmodium protein, unknown function [Plasmodium ovale]
MDRKKKNYESSEEKNNLKGSDEKLGDARDPLVKLKEEREKLIQWSIKLKNNNSSFLSSDMVDMEKGEKQYSSDDSYEEKHKFARRFEMGIGTGSYNLSGEKEEEGRGENGGEAENEYDQLVHDEEEISEDTHNQGDHLREKKKMNKKNGLIDHTGAVKMRIRGTVDNKRGLHVNMREKDFQSESSFSEEDCSLLPNCGKGKVRIKKITIDDDTKFNKSDGKKYIERFYSEEDIFEKKDHGKDKFDYHSYSENSEKDEEHIPLYNNIDRNVNNKYSKKMPNINIKESFFKACVGGSSEESDVTMDEMGQGNMNTLDTNSDDTHTNMGNDNKEKWDERDNIENGGRRRIKLTRKPGKGNIMHLLNGDNEKEDVRNLAMSESTSGGNDNSKSSSDSVKTFLPIPSVVNLKDNTSCTTFFSGNNEMLESNGNVNGTKIKSKEGSKFGTILKEKVHILKKKKEILNDKIRDLHDNTYTLMDVKEKDNLTIQHYEMLIKNLEGKYNKLFNMYQELDEHRISYVDAYREKQTKIENLCAIMQIKSEETLKLSQELDILRKNNEELQGQIYEYMKDIEEKEITLNKKKEECVHLNNQISSSNKEKENITNQLNMKSKEYNNILNQNKILKEECEKIKIKNKTMGTNNELTHTFFTPKIKNLINILSKILHIFQLSEENILQYSHFFKENITHIENKLNNNNNICDDLIKLLDTNLVDSITNVVIHREYEHNEKNENMKIQFDDEMLKIYETNLNNVELANKYIKHLKKNLTQITNQRDYIRKKAILLSSGQGRLNDKPITKELKIINMGTKIFKCKYHSFTHKPVLIFMKILNNRFITWTKNVLGTRGFKKKGLIDIQDVTSISYGLNSRPVYWLIEKKNKEKLEKKKITLSQYYDNAYKINPCKCFTLFTKERAYDFFSNDEDVIEAWVVGLGALSYAYNKSANIQSRSEFIIKKVQLKLKLYCIKGNINYIDMWKDAIKKTEQQLLR